MFSAHSLCAASDLSNVTQIIGTCPTKAPCTSLIVARQPWMHGHAQSGLQTLSALLIALQAAFTSSPCFHEPFVANHSLCLPACTPVCSSDDSSTPLHPCHCCMHSASPHLPSIIHFSPPSDFCGCFVFYPSLSGWSVAVLMESCTLPLMIGRPVRVQGPLC